ncbi:MAG: hypothetical protein RL433_897 [Actinomycetota bacterium]
MVELGIAVNGLLLMFSASVVAPDTSTVLEYGYPELVVYPSITH